MDALEFKFRDINKSTQPNHDYCKMKQLMHSNTQQIDDYKKAGGSTSNFSYMHFFFTSLCLNFYQFDFRVTLNKNGVFIKKNVNAFLQSVKKCKEQFLDV